MKSPFLRDNRRTLRQIGFLAGLLIGACVLYLSRIGLVAHAQEAVTATPIPINLVTPTPGNVAQPTPSPTWTATPPGLAVLEPLDTANVRAEPDVNSQQLGVIRSGERYTVTARYFEWYQFQFDGSPTGRAWVFGQLVTISGETSAIPELTAEPAATVDPLLLGATETSDSLILTPGGAETATAAARGVVATLSIPSANNSGSLPGASTSAANTELLPTFTYPPSVVRVTPAPDGAQANAPDPLELTGEDLQNLPPIVPILLLGGFGALGLVLTGLRRR